MLLTIITDLLIIYLVQFHAFYYLFQYIYDSKIM